VSRLDPTLKPNEAPVRRLEVITGVGGRRLWSNDEKARIVEETLVDGAAVSEVARRHGVSPQQLFTWRRLARQRAEERRSDGQSFAPVLIETAPAVRADARPIEIVVGDVTVRVPVGADLATLKAVLKVVRTAS
jgi:transposase